MYKVYTFIDQQRLDVLRDEKLKKFQEAHDQYLEAINIDSRHANAYNNLINLYYMAKNYSEALRYIENAEANGVKVNTELKKSVLKALEK